MCSPAERLPLTVTNNALGFCGSRATLVTATALLSTTNAVVAAKLAFKPVSLVSAVVVTGSLKITRNWLEPTVSTFSATGTVESENDTVLVVASIALPEVSLTLAETVTVTVVGFAKAARLFNVKITVLPSALNTALPVLVVPIAFVAPSPVKRSLPAASPV